MKKRKKILNELEKLQELQKIKLDIQKLQREEEQLIQKIRQAQIKLSQSIASGNNAKYTIDKINILEKKNSRYTNLPTGKTARTRNNRASSCCQ